MKYEQQQTEKSREGPRDKNSGYKPKPTAPTEKHQTNEQASKWKNLS